MPKKAQYLSALPLLFVAGIVDAGQYVKGYGESVSVATNNAFSAARQTVASRGSGCIGPGKGSDVEPIKPPRTEGDFIVVEVFISHHDGSCGIDKGFLEDFERETGVKINL